MRALVLVGGALLLAAACVAPRTREVKRLGLVHFADGGSGMVSDDGTVSEPVTVGGFDCQADAGAFLRLLEASRACSSDDECFVHRHGLAVDALDVCYPVHVSVRTSRPFIDEFHRLNRACGRATVFSMQGCGRAVCVDQRCQLSRAVNDGGR